ncbi:type II toxin-antitoxin system RelE/ParE family toxin [Candidatus Pantoea multigeneris]|uniref:Type II toxin-antitoxin system RelE/ParE family toxin n=1 Tax=Candidatus Pantoea multigeneris TaxID=2608357 RepID=A0ABX0RA86_9GAMM|nr:type II toxin-antitoxin system RelE/ParE family toxin [Pantoea multigeneris]NIF21679.1 type II toxin-antitoxin system RelE/ParE family toxin [Pantoea multigeneris]
MCAEKTEQEIEVFQSSRFEKAFNRLNKMEQDSVDDEIDRIIENPEIGERKKGDLSYLWVHKFYLGKQQYLLGYSWLGQKLEIYLLSMGTHENYYDEQKRQRKADLKLIG